MTILSLLLKTLGQASWLHRTERGATCWLSMWRIREFLQLNGPGVLHFAHLQTKGLGLGLGLYVGARLAVRMFERVELEVGGMIYLVCFLVRVAQGFGLVVFLIPAFFAGGVCTWNRESWLCFPKLFASLVSGTLSQVLPSPLYK